MSITKILVLGKTGEGKSTLCNYILKYNEKNVRNPLRQVHALKRLMVLYQIIIRTYL